MFINECNSGWELEPFLTAYGIESQILTTLIDAGSNVNAIERFEKVFI